MIGKNILHYKITDKLGAGGMGEVYLAHDERLDREVALKFLPAHVQSDPMARERFLREALAAARKGVEMMPVSKEAKQGPWRVRELAEVLILVGEYDEAIDKIEYLLSIPAGSVTVPYMKIAPLFDPIRDHPRFKEIIARG